MSDVARLAYTVNSRYSIRCISHQAVIYSIHIYVQYGRLRLHEYQHWRITRTTTSTDVYTVRQYQHQYVSTSTSTGTGGTGTNVSQLRYQRRHPHWCQHPSTALVAVLVAGATTSRLPSAAHARRLSAVWVALGSYRTVANERQVSCPYDKSHIGEHNSVLQRQAAEIDSLNHGPKGT